MSLNHILLGMLKTPASGYDLCRDFESGPRHFWSARLAQIYPALQNLEKRGLLASRMEPSERGPARRVYRRTAAGTRELRRWLRKDVEVSADRLAHIGQLIFLGELHDLQRTLQYLTTLRKRFASTQQMLENAERSLRDRAQGRAPIQLNDDEFHELLCLRMGVRTMRARVAACVDCIKLVETRIHRSEQTHVES